MKSDKDLIEPAEEEEELKAGAGYGTNRGDDFDPNMLSGNRTGEMQGVGLLEENGVTSSGYKTKELENQKVIVHTNKNFRVIEDA